MQLRNSVGKYMNKIAKYISCFFLIICFAVFAKSPVEIQTFNTSNGVKVLFTEKHELPMLDIIVTFRTGSARDGALPGLAQFTSGMLNEGTRKLDSDQIAANFDSVGAQFGVNANHDMTSVSLRTLSDPKILKSAFETYIDVISDADFPKTAIERVRKQLSGALDSEDQQPSSIAQDEYFRKLYIDQPYAHPVLGDRASIKSITRNDLMNFYHKYYNAQNAMIVLVGNIDLNKAKQLANQIAQKLPNGNAAPKLVLQKNVAQKNVYNINFPSEQTHIIMGEIGIAKNDPDFFPLMVGNYILGQAPLISDLFLSVRVKHGLVYNIGSEFITMEAPGPFAISLQTSNEQAKDAISVVEGALQKFMQQGPTEEQLRTAQNSIDGQFMMSLASNSSIASALNQIGFYNLPLNYLDAYISKVNGVTLPQISDAFKRHIDTNKMIIVMVGNSTNKAQ